MAVLSHDLNEQMVAKLGQEYPAAAAVADFATRLGGKQDSAAVEECAEQVLGGYGTRLIQRAMELGEECPDQAYEILKAAANKTGRLYFPHVAQRFLEITYLATQPISTVDIVENNHYRLVHRMGPHCVIYKAVGESCGKVVSDQMPCRHVCMRLLQGLYDSLRLDVVVTQESSMSKDGQCRFVGANNRPLEPTPWKR